MTPDDKVTPSDGLFTHADHDPGPTCDGCGNWPATERRTMVKDGIDGGAGHVHFCETCLAVIETPRCRVCRAVIEASSPAFVYDDASGPGTCCPDNHPLCRTCRRDIRFGEMPLARDAVASGGE
ncbi:hypothetical protein ACKVMT_02815 [Halobacteriales archaeon Cl-PHB]